MAAAFMKQTSSAHASVDIATSYFADKKAKVKLTVEQAMKAQTGSENISLIFL
jgi:hypothetical protein